MGGRRRPDRLDENSTLGSGRLRASRRAAPHTPATRRKAKRGALDGSQAPPYRRPPAPRSRWARCPGADRRARCEDPCPQRIRSGGETDRSPAAAERTSAPLATRELIPERSRRRHHGRSGRSAGRAVGSTLLLLTRPKRFVSPERRPPARTRGLRKRRALRAGSPRLPGACQSLVRRESGAVEDLATPP